MGKGSLLDHTFLIVFYGMVYSSTLKMEAEVPSKRRYIRLPDNIKPLPENIQVRSSHLRVEL